jgi:hypothetical protein
LPDRGEKSAAWQAKQGFFNDEQTKIDKKNGIVIEGDPLITLCQIKLNPT